MGERCWLLTSSFLSTLYHRHSPNALPALKGVFKGSDWRAVGVPSGTTRRGKVTFIAQDRTGSLDPERSTDSERGEMREPS